VRDISENSPTKDNRNDIKSHRMKIELRNVCKSFNRLKVLDKINLSFDQGQIIALLGANGAGKTTLLRTLSGIVAPDSGELLFDEQKFSRTRLDLRQRFHFLPDFPALYDDWTLLQHIGMVLRLYGVTDKNVESKTLDLLKEFDLLPLIDSLLGTLSRGQRYKAALVAMIAVDPELWLLDEPFASGMDPNGLNAFKRWATEAVTQRKRTVIYSTQILDSAERFSDCICVIHKGIIHFCEKKNEKEILETRQNTALENLFNQLHQEDHQ